MKTGKILFGTIFIMILVALFVCVVGEDETSVCEFNNCYNIRKDGSSYCNSHEPGSLLYQQESYREWKYTSQATKNTDFTTSTYSKSYSGSYSGTYKSYNSYDEGYDDVYMNEDYDMDRYYSDDDYAMGVDDAMEDEDW